MHSNRTNLDELSACSLAASHQSMAPAMQLALQANFDSLERWRSEFVALATARRIDSRWLTLTFDPSEGALVHRHDADGVPLLAIDLRAHAAAVVDALVDRIDWAAAYERYQAAVHDASEAFGAGPDELGGARLLDVRRAGVFEKAASVLPGARWCDPAAVGAWADELPRDREVVVYCVYGHEVGRATALRLRAHHIPARFLRGGIDAWQAAGRPLELKGVAS
jgi:Fe-Mn family superoxide dismutase